jgi:hypothetical protein
MFCPGTGVNAKTSSGVLFNKYLWIYAADKFFAERGRPTKGQNRPNKMGKIELKFLQIIFSMADTRAYMMVYEDGKNF